MILKILYKDKRIEEIPITRFSDISTHKTNLYYYEKYYDESGKGTCIKREDVDCVEIVL